MDSGSEIHHLRFLSEIRAWGKSFELRDVRSYWTSALTLTKWVRELSSDSLELLSLSALTQTSNLCLNRPSKCDYSLYLCL